MPTPSDLSALTEQVQRSGAFLAPLRREMSRVVVGQDDLVERLLIGLLTGGHLLLEGVPGLAKTLVVSTLAKAVEVSFNRIQFTPDLLPSDLVGTLVYNQQESQFYIRKGPIFANFILADEINRAPAKVQSALLEAMQERQVTIGEHTFPLEAPFLVLATQNPIEQEGTYPLPEAQVDRFLMKLLVSYPSREEELEIMRRMARTTHLPQAKTVVHPADILAARDTLNALYMDARVEEYIVDLVMATRYPDRYKQPKLKRFIEYGASPRATIALNLAARAHAFLHQRAYVTPDDVRAIARDVLRHRVSPTFEGEAEQWTPDLLVNALIETVPVP